MRAFLTILGLQLNCKKGDFETWQDEKDNVVILCVSEPEIPVLSISAILKDVNETDEAFTRIISVIN